MSDPKQGRGWLIYFIVLGVMALAATLTLGVFNMRQQLTRKQLEDAITRWLAKGPTNYTMVYLVNRNDGNTSDRYEVIVRNGQAIQLFLNHKEVRNVDLSSYGMHRLLADIDGFLKFDEDKANPRSYLRGYFDPDNGRLYRFIRRVMGGRERVEIVVDDFKAE